MDRPAYEQQVSGSGLPALALVAGVVSVPLQFVSGTSFVLAGALVLAAWFSAFVVVVDRRPARQRAVAVAGALVGLGSVLLFVLPLVLQD